MGIKNVSRGEGGFNQQGKVRQSLMGTQWVQVGEYERKTSVNGKPFISGRCVVAGAGDSFTFFSFWPTDKNSLDDFEARYPQDEGGYWLVTASQNSKEGDKDGKKVINTYTSINVVGFKDDFDETRDGILTGTLMLDVDGSKYREANGEKQAWVLLKANADSSYEKDGVLVEKHLTFELQGFGKVADAAYQVLSGDDIVNGVPVYVRARVSGSRLILVNVNVSKAAPEALSSGSDDAAPESTRTPSLESFGGGKGTKKGKTDPKNPWEG